MLPQSAFWFLLVPPPTKVGGPVTTHSDLLESDCVTHDGKFESGGNKIVDDVSQFLECEDRNTRASAGHNWHRRSGCFGFEPVQFGECLQCQNFCPQHLYKESHTLLYDPACCPAGVEGEAEWEVFRQLWTAHYPSPSRSNRAHGDSCEGNKGMSISQSGTKEMLDLSSPETIGAREFGLKFCSVIIKLGHVLLACAPGVARKCPLLGGVCVAAIYPDSSLSDMKMSVRQSPVTVIQETGRAPKFTSRDVALDHFSPRLALALPFQKPNLIQDFGSRIESRSARLRLKQSLELVLSIVVNSHLWPLSSLILTCPTPELEEDFSPQDEAKCFRYGPAVRIKIRPAWSQQHTFSSQKSGPRSAASARYPAKNAFGTMVNWHLGWPSRSSYRATASHFPAK